MTIMSKAIIGYIVFLAIFALLVITVGADAPSDPCNPYQDMDFCNPAMDVEPTYALFPTINPMITPPVLCTADCNVQSVQVCIPNTTHCTYVDALYCTVPQSNQCVQVFNSFVD